MDMPQARSFAEVEVHLASVHQRLLSLEHEIRAHDHELDTFVRTAAWKRWLFILDGWSGHRVVSEPKWRPWRKWWRS